MGEETTIAEQSAATGIPAEHFEGYESGNEGAPSTEAGEGATPSGDAGQTGATPQEGAAGAEGQEDFEFEYKGRRFSPEKMGEILDNYDNLQTEYGRKSNELAELKRQREAGQQPTGRQEGTPAKPAKPAPEIEKMINEADLEDPEELRRVFSAVLTENAHLKRTIQEVPKTMEATLEEREAQAEMRHVMSSNPNMKPFEGDSTMQEAICRVSAALGVARNRNAGKTLYPDLNSSVNAFFATMKGEQAPMKQAQFIKILKRGEGGPALPASGGKPIGDVVQRYKALKTQDERVKFMEKLTDEEQKIIDNAVYTGEIA